MLWIACIACAIGSAAIAASKDRSALGHTMFGLGLITLPAALVAGGSASAQVVRVSRLDAMTDKKVLFLWVAGSNGRGDLLIGCGGRYVARSLDLTGVFRSSVDVLARFDDRPPVPASGELGADNRLATSREMVLRHQDEAAFA